MSGNQLPVMLQMLWLQVPMIACAIIGSRLDYCNSMFYDTSRHVKTLIISSASRTVQHGSCVALVDGSKVHGSYVTEIHWLPVGARTDFKLATLSYKSRMTGQPDYLVAELINHSSVCVRLHRNC